MKNNKGFSLVELIIVIAIMAILVGVMAPQLIKYIEKSNVSADTQLADTVHSACLTAAMDPEVIEDTNAVIPTAWTTVNSLDDTEAFGRAVRSIVGIDADHPLKLKSCDQSKVKLTADAIEFKIEDNRCSVVIINSDKSGSKGQGAVTGAQAQIGVY